MYVQTCRCTTTEGEIPSPSRDLHLDTMKITPLDHRRTYWSCHYVPHVNVAISNAKFGTWWNIITITWLAVAASVQLQWWQANQDNKRSKLRNYLQRSWGFHSCGCLEDDGRRPFRMWNQQIIRHLLHGVDDDAVAAGAFVTAYQALLYRRLHIE